MESSSSPSPLTRQSRPDSFQPKIVQLYSDLFNVRPSCRSKYVGIESHIYQVRNHVLPSEGFWREFFLLPPDKGQFRQILEPLTADNILNVQVCFSETKLILKFSLLTYLLQEQTREFFARAIEEVRMGKEPRNQNALEVGPAILSVSPIDLPYRAELDCFSRWCLVKKIHQP
jgi:hypothetical protein